jgi:hypothetical protein
MAGLLATRLLVHSPEWWAWRHVTDRFRISFCLRLLSGEFGSNSRVSGKDLTMGTVEAL